MPLPSKYGPLGLSKLEQSQWITLGTPSAKKPVNFTLRNVENRIEQAASHHDGDIEMIAMDDPLEVAAVSQYVDYSRHINHATADIDMDHEASVQPGVAYEVIQGNQSYLIIDTNFILSHLNIVNELATLASKYRLKLVVPIAVMKELDGLKNSTKAANESDSRLSGRSIGHLARWANDWIYAGLASKSTVIIGQKMNQRIDRATVQDEAILDCCLWYQQNYSSNLVVLLSNDKNLCLKALTNNTLTVSYRPSMTGELIGNVIYTENVQRYGEALSVHQPVPSTIDASAVSSVIKSTVTTSPAEESLLHQACSTIYDEVQKLTLSVVHRCMESSYGDDLDLLRDYDKNAIVNLHDCSQVFIRFWMVVFQQYLGHGDKPFEQMGLKRVPKWVDVPQTAGDLREFVNFWSEILRALYAGEMDDSQNQALSLLIERWEELSRKY
ncbi:uncharacterized protein CANTADRAFT_52088 [Suhomyces tanzawaensis NRRL Y-17324]|uniref:Transcriptional protein SWT1 n=1 Tax=Suhomyces tanzawaensis NRRL Y-17324 TaxID=984487 RepID=A0A1E4SI34_9ASCO|nr:uncharacterized protein CANTADRAFT_52088 [Suhomyces tanzawaensis NRRL Y-17324]ODV79092.1 hypothetical protein CANTADRAFT_52088 [Suhomyces tanzawaensis NRRL Y-17324]